MELSDQQRRHSAAHMMARAIMNLFEGVQVDIGPATEEGFYYDFDLEHRLSPEDFPKIEAEIARLIAQARHVLIIKIFRQELCLEFLHVRDLLELLLDVALV